MSLLFIGSILALKVLVVGVLIFLLSNRKHQGETPTKEETVEEAQETKKVVEHVERVVTYFKVPVWVGLTVAFAAGTLLTSLVALAIHHIQ